MYSERAAEFCAELEAEEGCPAWVIGTVVEGERRATIRDTPNILEV
jgi:selenophosphate synthetase-related protein